MIPSKPRIYRILQIHPFPQGGGRNPGDDGESRLSLQLSRELALRGQKIGIFPYPEPISARNHQIQNTGSPLQVLPTTILASLPAAGWYSWKALRLPVADKSLHSKRMVSMFLAGLHQAVRNFNPDVVQNHAPFSDIPLLYHAVGLTVPLILSHHAHTIGRHLDLYRVVVFSTEYLRSKACAMDASLYDRTQIIRPAVDRLFADPAITIPGNRKGILFVGGPGFEKSMRNLFMAYVKNAALRRNPLRIIGVGPEKKSFREYVRRHKIPATFLGKLAPDQVHREMLAAELLVNPGPVDGYSLTLPEAMCCGTPVIGWTPQVEETNTLLRMECGAGFDPAQHEPEVLADWILEMRARRTLISTTHRRRLAAKARAYFSIERYTTEYMCLYDELVDGHV
jgi:glycosyltransferase involved in cell wall biosynthesis